jgi:kumamolisin
VSKARVVLPGSHRDPLPGHERIGLADPSESIKVTVVLRRKEEVLPITPYRAPARKGEYTKAHGARDEDIETVRNFAKEYNLIIDPQGVSKAHRTIELHGTVGDLSRAFGVGLDKVKLNAEEFRHRTGDIIVPAELIPAVQAVLGLDNRPIANPHFVKIEPEAVRAAAAQPFSPTVVAELYNFPTSLDGSGQTIAIIELDGGFLQSDLDVYFPALGLATPIVSTVLLDGQTNQINKHLPQHPELNADDEVALDIEVAGAVAPGANQVVYFAQNTDQSFLKAINTAIHASPQPVAISISWGQAEKFDTQQFMKSFEAALQDAANLGIPVCVASGDDGSFDNAGALAVDFPASAPHALGCGGTNLIASGGAISSETVWNAVVTGAQGESVRQGTGGGVSEFFAKPSYQSATSVPPPPGGSTGGRGVPDVCGDADPATGYNVRIKGDDTFVGGTSAVAPLWAGLIARFGQSMGGPVGFLHPKIYQSAVNFIGFRDITEGDNDSQGKHGLYHAGPGWDACTGMGSPKGAALLKALSPPPPPPHPKPTPQPTPKPTPSPTPTPHSKPAPSGGTDSTGSPPHFEFPPLPAVFPAQMQEQAPPPAIAAVQTGLVSGLTAGSNTVALVGVAGLAAVMGMVAAAGIIAAVAIRKDNT